MSAKFTLRLINPENVHGWGHKDWEWVDNFSYLKPKIVIFKGDGEDEDSSENMIVSKKTMTEICRELIYLQQRYVDFINGALDD